MARQGLSFEEKQIRRVVQLLATTDMTVRDIAERLGCSRAAIVAINRRFQVRDYAGRRSTWEVAPAFSQNTEPS